MRLRSIGSSVFLIVGLLLSFVSIPAHAASSLTSPVTIILPLAAGGPNDIEARMYAGHLNTLTGHQFLVDYKLGAGGTIAAGYVAKSAPDGRTLLLSGGSFSASPALYRDLSFDIIKDFSHIALMSIKHMVLVASSEFSPATFEQYVAYNKASPGKANFGTTGAGGSVHLAGAWLHGLLNSKVTFVHYKGAALGTTDLAAGRVQLSAITLQQALPLIKTGKIRALALMGPRRSDLLPGIPTVNEQVPGFNYESWVGFSAAANTPEAIVKQLNDGFAKVARLAEVRKALEAQGGAAIGGTPNELRQLIQDESSRWRKVAQENGIRLEE